MPENRKPDYIVYMKDANGKEREIGKVYDHDDKEGFNLILDRVYGGGEGFGDVILNGPFECVCRPVGQG